MVREYGQGFRASRVAAVLAVIAQSLRSAAINGGRLQAVNFSTAIQSKGEITMSNYSYITASADVKTKISQVMRALGVCYEVSGCGD